MLLHDNKQNEVSFLYTPAASLRFTDANKAYTNVTAFFSTNINEARVTSIDRRTSYNSEHQASIPALREDIVKKYGAPSYIDEKNGQLQMYFVWYRGKRVQLSRQAVSAERFIKVGSPAHCMNISPPQQYSYGKKDIYANCTTLIAVTISEGRRKDLALTLNIFMQDHKRFAKNARDTDAWLDAEMKKRVEGQKGVRSRL